MKKILSLMRKCIDDFKMIEDGDRIAVGLSGGKDSLALATALKLYQRFSPQKFELVAIIIDLFNGQTDYSKLLDYAKSIDLECHLVPSEIYNIVFEERKESNPCSLCAKLRRGILNTEAVKLGCNKVALGHHADDLIETFFLSLFYEGRLSSFSPTTYLSRTDVTVIRPLVYVNERLIVGATKNLPIVHNCCPADKHTQRQYIKELYAHIQKEIPFVKERVHDAILHPERNNLITTDKKNKQ